VYEYRKQFPISAYLAPDKAASSCWLFTSVNSTLALSQSSSGARVAELSQGDPRRSALKRYFAPGEELAVGLGAGCAAGRGDDTAIVLGSRYVALDKVTRNSPRSPRDSGALVWDVKR
jgi:hypothetical protein